MEQILEPNGEARATLILDDSGASKTLRQKLESSDWRAHTAACFKEFRKLFKQHRFEVVIVFFDQNKIPDTSELEILSTLNITTKWIAVVPSEQWLEAQPNVLFSHLYYDYHRQPLRYDHLLATIGHAYGMAKLQRQKLKCLTVQHNKDDIIGHSKETEKLRKRIAIVSKETVPVLISGDSGTGKQFISQILHKQSSVAAGPLGTLNCGAISEPLIQSELFGHQEGNIHTGSKTKMGQIQQCHQGTLLLNDIEELPLSAQSSLAQFIEQKESFPLGADKMSTSCCRIIATTSSDLEKLVQKKLFRNDLYQALSTTTIKIPTLNERHHDIEYLAQYFLIHFCEQGEKKSFTQCAIAAMQQYHWPGNVRELMNRIRRAIILSEGELIHQGHLELPKDNNPQNLTLKDARDKVEKDIVVRTIAQAGYNHSKAAKDLGISRTSLYRLISKHEIPL